MNLNPRQHKLLEAVRAQGSAAVEELARALRVTPQTIRRDIHQLAEAGWLSRFHGGAAIPGSTTENIGYQQRKLINATGKRRIGRSVAAQVRSGMSLFLNIGTTTEQIARELLAHRDLRVVTNNLNVAAILADNPRCEVIVAGGVVRSRDRGIVGEATIDFIRQFKVDVGLIGISSIEPDGSLRDFDYREVKVTQTIIGQTREVWLAADQSKFARRAMVQVAQLSQIDVLFTDSEPPAALQAMLKDAGGRLVVAAGDTPEGTGADEPTQRSAP